VGPTGPGGVRVRIGKVWIDALSFDGALDAIEALVEGGQGGSVFTPNVDHIVTAEDNAPFQAAYLEASLSLADGQPLLWAARWLRTPLPEKISGSDLVWPLLQRAGSRRWRVFLLGGAPGVAAEAAAKVERELGVVIAGVDDSVIPADPGASGGTALVERVRSARPDLVLVALGAPKQELWISRSLPKLRPAVMIGVGASLDFVTGRLARAPRWVSRGGLEWLWRLVREPRRLAYRYLVKDPRFLAILLRTARLPRGERLRGQGT
jgi:N-acetylglucosaminyldiphosphoundecaprenol N-acetyl-beta-D-mannosaminyltransferase